MDAHLRLEMTFPPPPERVFGAFVDAQQLRQWWGPVGFTVAGLEFRPEEGSDYRIEMQPPEGDVFHVRGTFRAIEAPRLLAFTFVYEEPDPDDQETLVTVRFEQVGQATRVLLDQGPFRTAARLALHRDGWTQTLERLGEFLT
jgi:uncharacterized protein YndB with AHSA1/START domain